MAADNPTTAAGGTSLTIAAALACAIAAGVALFATFPLRSHARSLGLLDPPTERSSHRVATPRGGGVAIIFGTAAALLFLWTSGVADSAAWTLFGVAAAVGVAGVLDDRFGLPPLLKLAAHLFAAAVIVAAFGPLGSVPLPPPLNVPIPVTFVAWTLSLLWIATVVNFFNFMDGIDGLAAGQAAASCIGIAAAAWASEASLLAVAVLGACLGFLFHNAPPARIFMGDAGSGFLGFILAVLPFVAPAPRRGDAVLAVAVGLTLFLLDPIVTVVKRAIQGKNILRAHREHLYQQLVAPEEHAGRVTAWYAALAVLLALCGAAGYRTPFMSWIGCIAGACAFLGIVHRARHAQRARSARAIG